MKNKKRLSRKTVIILVITAIVLASFAIAYHYFDLGSKVSTEFEEKSTESLGGGKVGIKILPPPIEDKGEENVSG